MRNWKPKVLLRLQGVWTASIFFDMIIWNITLHSKGQGSSDTKFKFQELRPCRIIFVFLNRDVFAFFSALLRKALLDQCLTNSFAFIFVNGFAWFVLLPRFRDYSCMGAASSIVNPNWFCWDLICLVNVSVSWIAFCAIIILLRLACHIKIIILKKMRIARRILGNLCDILHI